MTQKIREFQQWFLEYVDRYIEEIKRGIEDKSEIDDPENKMIGLMQFREFVKHDIQAKEIKKNIEGAVITNFEYFQSLSKDEWIDFLWKRLDPFHDYCPWDIWLDRNYCKNCQPVEVKNENGLIMKMAPCELNPCPYFATDERGFIEPGEVIKAWLNAPKSIDKDFNV